MKRVYDAEQQRIKEMQKLYVSQSQKTFEYKLEDFIIADDENNELGCKWKHKSWNTWMKGSRDAWDAVGKTQKMIATYILECSKPYGKRNLSMFHLA